MQIRRHHLIEEAKAELDVAYEGVKHAENRLMELEHEFNERIKGIKDANGAQMNDSIAALMAEKEERQVNLNLDVLYELQTSAVERFAAVSTAFMIVGSIEGGGKTVDLIRNILFRTDEIRSSKHAIDGAIREFAAALIAYSKNEATSENDKRVRDSWAAIELLLKDFGRPL